MFTLTLYLIILIGKVAVGLEVAMGPVVYLSQNHYSLYYMKLII